MHGRLGRRALPLLALGAALGSLSRPAQACGGFFCSQAQPVNQAAERIIFADNGDGTITAVIQILYEGPAEKFSWLLPISTVPEGDQLKVASDIAFTRLQAATNPRFNLNRRVEGMCRPFPRSPIQPTSASDSGAPRPLADDAAVSVEAQGVVGEFQWEVIRLTDPLIPDPAAPALEWLTQSGYDVTPEAAGLIGPYLADGMYLLALRLTKGADSGSIRPLQLTYAAEAPMIPIKLTAVAAIQDMGVMPFFLSDARAVPLNYNALELNEARINWFNPQSNYNRVVTEAADDAGGQGFVTEFAGDARQFANVIWLELEEREWQELRSASYQSLDDLLDTLRANYEQLNGFWDAVRRTVVLPEEVSFADFRACTSCFSERIELSPSQLFEAIEADVIEPIRGVQALIDRFPYLTRLYSTLSSVDMTRDPVFVFNRDLPPVNNVHTADLITECDWDLFPNEAPQRIELPQGSVLRFLPGSSFWPMFGDQPANVRVLTLSQSGEGRVVEDNTRVINAELAEYNAGIPGNRAESGGFCTLTAGPRPAAGSAWMLALGAGLASASLRRRRRPAGA